jgi:hypothetical protein
MARGNTYHCVVCGEEYQFCPKCQITRPNYDYERYCGKNHADIFAILSKHGCGLATAEETLNALNGYDLTGLSDSIKEHIKSLKLQNKAKALKEVESKNISTQE